MDKNVLQSIAGIEIYPLISFVIFFLFFLALLGYVALANRQHLRAMSELPLTADQDAAETLNHHFTSDVLC
ncbi:hypothetical protein [Hymenobacter persicinus]|jgi:hypothetical protein|uniref:CcoQ/FixQ family Cbb3-type cytochrome c oxidase assembly chaperone n=1 Tax=Hymenobacter persicinus TaxID=2025506 RepID=A0A4Q5LFE0_9BACT|nr:hypothetical protein [Hymenobacter persicinus]RYU81535.1 hypothetical protein EWM57_05930 [Hymenobacter persicinus]